MPWIEFLSGRTCILLWILYGNMVDFSFIVSLYVSDLFNVTISTGTAQQGPSGTFSCRARTRSHPYRSHKCYLILDRLRVRGLFRQAFAVCHKMWPYRRDSDAANLSKKIKFENEPCRTIFRG